ncbi:Plasmid pRiA4b ORF-3-like protein [Planctomycetes bacterium Pan216]|uniref:Plasmid pRiA4b ORF-3-like protein n=1 Tax=Kolteria novifilia TaxID=2527975 RepID=A0A518AXG7_9BACT|nr:Plasmid pRiA4b ORF-3-like protein [Planctomycetes bacterium Pan216]
MPETSIDVRLTQTQRTFVAELTPELTERLCVEKKQPRSIAFTKAELLITRQTVRQLALKEEHGTKRIFLQRLVDRLSEALGDATKIAATPVTKRCYQLKITLIGSDPPIWRRIQMNHGTLDELHHHIQLAMGWTNSHLHQFIINDEYYVDIHILGEDDDFSRSRDSTRTKLSGLLPRNGKPVSFLYEYDFGDSWEHEVILEGWLPLDNNVRYPRCLEGARACPPEDVGGIWGYDEYLEILADPSHERHQWMLMWGGPFDPEAFDVEQTTKAMQEG